MSSAQILKIDCGACMATSLCASNESNLQIPSSVDWKVDPGRAMLRRDVRMFSSKTAAAALALGGRTTQAPSKGPPEREPPS
ncbi:hypothetical protein TESG_08249 [Trichophyton tonsurans CBS 112818]|uniref:Uncharacterized protein n=2 Tax=Trichophyton TaxID=5550 RepID=F2PQK7_TRIEC|nr:hypothetical protein TESG_08249 [Trichophyton tonsurans CBS 112818]EGE04175.1 hypothetical protein TEQG_03208 [Trichophyton equinum CBS 127.97]